jgi:hypothetical protein
MIRPNRLTGMLAAAAICLAVVGSSHAQAMNFTIDGVPRQALILASANASRSTERLPLLFGLPRPRRQHGPDCRADAL